MRRLSDFLKMIGQEIHDRSYVDAEGTIRVITKDEQLAREVWKRALGYEEEVTNDDKTVTHRVFRPDPKAQQFIFERLEGKFIEPQEEKGISLLDRISELAKSKSNEIAKQVIDDNPS